MARMRDEDFDRMIDASIHRWLERPVESFMESAMTSTTYTSSTNDGTNYVEYLDKTITRLRKLGIEEVKPKIKRKEKVTFQFDPEELIDG